jgi:hypothetical protein
VIIKKILVEGGFPLHGFSEKFNQFSIACAPT